MYDDDSELGAEILDLRDEVATLRRELHDTDAQIIALRATAWHRLGRALNTARRPRAWRRLVRRAGSALGGGGRRRSGQAAIGTDAASMLVGAAASPPDGPVRRPDLRVAAILDTFSSFAFRYEWTLVDEFGQDDWRTVLAADPPDLLFVESAWNGNGGRWRLAMSSADAPRQPLRELVAWCREQGIPTVFWNKEDPPNFERFIETARLFDHVFTVDSDCVARYVETLGHRRVAVLPFAAAPRIHNPISVAGGRSHDVAFAGTYFAEKHPARREQMEIVLAPAREHGLTIFSRQGGKDPRYAFPAAYQPYVIGTLDYPQMLTAYKRFRVFLNVNSVVGSPSMCARRVFELSAANTAVVSGPSVAVPAFFGDRITIVESPDETSAALRTLLRQDEFRERKALRAMRHVFAEHTYAHRADDVLRTVGLDLGTITTRPPTVSVLLATKRPEQLAHAVAQVARQAHPALQLVLVLHGDGFDPAEAERLVKENGIDDFVVLPVGSDVLFGDALNLGVDAADGRYIAKMDDDDIYGDHYLGDQLNAFTYTDAAVVGKATHYAYLRDLDATMLRFPGMEHRYTFGVKGPTLVVDGEVLRSLRFGSLPRAIDTDLLERIQATGARSYATDRYNFAFVRHADPTRHTYQIDEAALLRNGRIVFYGPPEPHICA